MSTRTCLEYGKLLAMSKGEDKDDVAKFEREMAAWGNNRNHFGLQASTEAGEL